MKKWMIFHRFSHLIGDSPAAKRLLIHAVGKHGVLWSSRMRIGLKGSSLGHCLCFFDWLVVWIPLKNISQLGLLFPMHGKIKHVPNHQPVDIFLTTTVILVWGVHRSVFSFNRFSGKQRQPQMIENPVRILTSKHTDFNHYTSIFVGTSKPFWEQGIEFVRHDNYYVVVSHH